MRNYSALRIRYSAFNWAGLESNQQSPLYQNGAFTIKPPAPDTILVAKGAQKRPLPKFDSAAGAGSVLSRAAGANTRNHITGRKLPEI